ncbi:uncharacterized protein LOC116215543 [Punica granatum]|uniref:Uncharacterized protein LOC116215543 n=1 Tax=Punica granatum TaxID=22663 RepID=A0A6P8EK77_PUNGR|nr:uncharacterized protein LOC116215543 [Punica granatum]
MSGRTFVVIFVFWALLMLITPTLIHLSESAKHGDWRSEEITTRKMVDHLKKYISKSPTTSSPPESSPAPTAGLASGPETSESKQWTWDVGPRILIHQRRRV